MRPSAQPLIEAVRAYSIAGKPTPQLVQALAVELAKELARTQGEPVSVSIGGFRIARSQ